MEKVEAVDGGQDSSSSLPAEKSNGLTSVIKNKKKRRGYLPAFDNNIQRFTISQWIRRCRRRVGINDQSSEEETVYFVGGGAFCEEKKKKKKSNQNSTN